MGAQVNSGHRVRYNGQGDKNRAIILAPETQTPLRERAAENGTEPDVLARTSLIDLMAKPILRCSDSYEPTPDFYEKLHKILFNEI